MTFSNKNYDLFSYFKPKTIGKNAGLQRLMLFWWLPCRLAQGEKSKPAASLSTRTLCDLTDTDFSGFQSQPALLHPKPALIKPFLALGQKHTPASWPGQEAGLHHYVWCQPFLFISPEICRDSAMQYRQTLSTIAQMSFCRLPRLLQWSSFHAPKCP